MTLKYTGYSFIGALFAIVTDIAIALSYVITILTLGWVGRKWPLRIHLFCLGNRFSVVYEDGVDAHCGDDHCGDDTDVESQS